MRSSCCSLSISAASGQGLHLPYSLIDDFGLIRLNAFSNFVNSMSACRILRCEPGCLSVVLD